MRKGMFSVLRKANLIRFFFKGGGEKTFPLTKKDWENKNVVRKTHLKIWIC